VKKYTFLLIVLFSSCCRNRPTVLTDWNYNDPSNGGFQQVPFYPMEIPPESVVIDGGVFDLHDPDRPGKSDSVRPFVISKYEETNRQYRAYLAYLKRYGLDKKYTKALPDTLFWKDESFSQDEKSFLISNYFRSPLFDNYPVLGLDVKQVADYARWKTDRLNEMILVREGLLEVDTQSTDTSSMFTTDAYLSGTYDPHPMLIPSLSPTSGSERQVRMEDNILLPRLRLPTLREWEVAALDQGDSNYTYPVSKPFLRTRDIRKIHAFNFFYLKTGKAADHPVIRALAMKKLYPVNRGTPDRYNVYGLNANADEFVLPEGITITVGGSWKKGETRYGTDFRQGRYYARQDFLPVKQAPSFHSSYTGFRLAMNYIAYPYPNTWKLPLKRRKGKREFRG
jgi:hypothetical protein